MKGLQSDSFGGGGVGKGAAGGSGGGGGGVEDGDEVGPDNIPATSSSILQTLGLARRCLPRRPPHCRPSFIELN
jgi:hypothetical protein